MFGLLKRIFEEVEASRPKVPSFAELWHRTEQNSMGIDESRDRRQKEAEDRLDANKRKQWARSRLWHNGKHAHCCMRCMQAGYVMALLHAGRLDLMAEYPELNGVYEELLRDGMITGQKTDDFHQARSRTADRGTTVVRTR